MGEDQEWRRRRRRARRRHGLQHPLHPQQILAWLVMICFIALTFGAIVPALHSSLALPVAITSGLLFFSHIIAHIVALFLDPADPQLRAQKEKQHMPEFNRNLHSHVIENGRCHLCNITTTSARTKHCSACNKCVDVFDHHCKWLNHCIGKRNYKVFIVCVLTAILACMFIMGTCITEIVLYYFDREHLSPWEKGRLSSKDGSKEKENEDYDEVSPTISCEAGSPYCHFAIFGARIYDGAFIGILSGLFSAALIAEVLLIHLAAFHAYINYLGLTTYEYIRGNNLRDNSSSIPFNAYSKERNSDPEGAVCGWTVIKRSSTNQITPSSTTDTSLLQTPSNESSVGSRSPRSASTNVSPSAQGDSPFNFNYRSTGQTVQNTSVRFSEDLEEDLNAITKYSSPQNTPRTPPSSTVPTLPQIPKPVRSRIGLRSTMRNAVSSAVKTNSNESEVEVRIVSIPRPRPSRRRLRSSVAPHLSPIKECDMATSSPPSVRGIPPSDSGSLGSACNTPSKSILSKSSNDAGKGPSKNIKTRVSSPCQKTSNGSITSQSPLKLNYQSNFKSTSESKHKSPSKTNHLKSPSHSSISSIPKVGDDYTHSPSKIFVVNEHSNCSPGKLKGLSNGKPLSSPSNRQPIVSQKSPNRTTSPLLNSPRLMAHINGKNVAITLLNGYVDNGGKSPNRQNGRIINRIVKSNFENGENNFMVGICKASDLRIIERDVINKNVDIDSRSSNDKSSRIANQNGTTHVELHM